MAFVSSLPVVDRVGTLFEASTRRFIFASTGIRMNASREPTADEKLVDWKCVSRLPAIPSPSPLLSVVSIFRLSGHSPQSLLRSLRDHHDADDEVEDPSVKAEASTLEDFLTFHAGGDSEGGFMPDMFISGYNFERTTVGEELEKERSSRSKPEPISLADALAFHVGADSPVTPAASEDYDEEDGEFE
eukprot:tig00000403_g332.t1